MNKFSAAIPPLKSVIIHEPQPRFLKWLHAASCSLASVQTVPCNLLLRLNNPLQMWTSHCLIPGLGNLRETRPGKKNTLWHTVGTGLTVFTPAFHFCCSKEGRQSEKNMHEVLEFMFTSIPGFLWILRLLKLQHFYSDITILVLSRNCFSNHGVWLAVSDIFVDWCLWIQCNQHEAMFCGSLQGCLHRVSNKLLNSGNLFPWNVWYCLHSLLHISEPLFIHTAV